MDYEANRRANIARNREAIMALLGKQGLQAADAHAIAFKAPPVTTTTTKPKPTTDAPVKKRTRGPTAIPRPTTDETSGDGRRKSRRLRGIEADAVGELRDVDGDAASDDSECSDDDSGAVTTAIKKKSLVPRENVFGAIDGVEVGSCWEYRLDCSSAGIHRPTVAGIHGSTAGCYSVCLSGGYEDDIDCGDAFTYTGEGGRDLKGTVNSPKNLRTAPQSKDQTLTKGNLALANSVENGNPVRVVRGYKLTSPFAPASGYRYDGLYRVVKYWYCPGLSGYNTYKFLFQRLPEQAPPPWTIVSSTEGEAVDTSTTK